MPIFFQQEIDANTRLAIWKIEEEEDFYTARVPLQRTITHPLKRLQHLAGRYLLQFLFTDFPLELIQIADTRKPFLEDEAFHFSISHCGDYAGVIVSKTARVGIDIELFTEKVQRIRHKFISAEEDRIINNQFLIFNTQVGSTGITDLTYQPINLSTLLWSCKEALFKWYGAGNVDFKADMQLQKLKVIDEKSFVTTFLFKKNGDLISLQSQFFDAICLSYVVT